MISAFGVDHGYEVSKARREAWEREAMHAQFGPESGPKLPRARLGRRNALLVAGTTAAAAGAGATYAVRRRSSS